MDEIIKASHHTLDTNVTSLIKGSIDAAETIQLCAQHQKNIVDDILTISKLDSKILKITPVPLKPREILEESIRMFIGECSTEMIKLDAHIESSIEELHVDVLMLDPSRLKQVLVNLLTNAIKFTKTEKKRSINVYMGASIQTPLVPPFFQYFPTAQARTMEDITDGEEWGSGQKLYLRFEVRDTGCGLTESEQKNLFTKFSQASPRTHVRYGGSGLGLFICRQLVELHCGEIGVGSKSGVGSTFAFYVKCRALPSTLSSTLEWKTQNAIAPNASSAIKLPRLISSTSSIPLSSMTADRKLTDWHVLIVEDNIVNQRVLAAQIKKLGCTVHVANHGGEALDLLKQTRYYKGKESDGREISVIVSQPEGEKQFTFQTEI